MRKIAFWVLQAFLKGFVRYRKNTEKNSLCILFFWQTKDTKKSCRRERPYVTRKTFYQASSLYLAGTLQIPLSWLGDLLGVR